jgi:hypothetical protein
LNKPIRIGHIINPFTPKKGSEFELAESVTFKSMKLAKEKAESSNFIQVNLFSAHFIEDEDYVPDFFQKTMPLEGSTLELGIGLPKLPFLGNILQRLSESSEDEYWIFTNVDISVQPNFYLEVAGYIKQGYDGFIINRRRISKKFNSLDSLPEMFQEKGKPHPGFDCFVFHRDLFSKFELGRVCLGIPFIGMLFAQNLFAFSEKFLLLDKEYLTFHIGEEVFKKRNQLLWKHNQKEFWDAINKIRPFLESKKWPFSYLPLPVRIIKWGLHPSLPIRLGLELEWKRIIGVNGK